MNNWFNYNTIEPFGKLLLSWSGKMDQYDTLRSQFAEQGYIHVPGFLTEAECLDAERHIDSYVRDLAPTLPRTEVMYDDYERPETLKRISRLQLDAFFEALRSQPKFGALAQALLQDEVVAQSLQYFNKPPGGDATPAHQDGYYFCLVPNEAITFWIPLDDVDDENGTLHYVSGSHLGGILPHQPSAVIGFSQGLAAADLRPYGEERICVVKRGDALIHHSRLIHLAGPNRSQRQRRALGQVYFARRAQVDPSMKQRYDAALDAQRKTAGLS